MDEVRSVLPPDFDVRKLGVHMPRSRHQRGFVVETGKRIKKWAGRFHIYVIDEQGKERRRSRRVIIGLKSRIKKWEAEQELAQIIERETRGQAQAKPDPELTFGWFWKNRYLPLKESNWGKSQRSIVDFVMENHMLPRFGKAKLRELNKFDIQMHLNDLARRYSESLVDKGFTYLNAALEEAVDQEFLDRNPIRKVELPKSRKPCRRHLSAAEIETLSNNLTGRDRLIVHLFIVCAFRPGELFALRWNDIEPGKIRVDEAVYRNHLGSPKTETSFASVSIPKSLEMELSMWKACSSNTAPEDFVFESRYRGRPMDPRSYLRRFLKPLATKLGIPGLTFQSLRRTFATQVQKLGSIKDAQTQLRHASASTTLNVYTQEMPESVRQTVEALDQKLFGIVTEPSRVN
jgi:integrase